MRTHVLTNTCSAARRWCATKASRYAWLLGLLALSAGCLADPHRLQSVELLDSLTAYRSDSYQWLQVAELTYDSFMIRMRTRA